MTELSIDRLLAARGVRLDGFGADMNLVRERAKLSRLIAENYAAFEVARSVILRRQANNVVSGRVRTLLAAIKAEKLATEVNGGWSVGPAAARYLRGGWLEEYAALAALAAGADEIRAGQVLRWVSGPFDGVNEVDVIARLGDQLLFVSCKALWSHLTAGDAAQRERLTAALHEADNTLDHFGGIADRTVLVVSTDLFDENNDQPRYRQLYGKAHALDVALVTLEDFEFDKIVFRLKELFDREKDPTDL